MGERALKNRIDKLMEIEAQRKAEIKADMEAKGQEEMRIGDYIVRFKEILSNRFDTKAFQADHKKLYEAYLKPAATKRFTVA